jgi:DNA repair exonuclease SbcCD ATPase subunit
MIKKLTIKNFQSHKNTEIDFDKGVNIIVGSTDSGKSAIIRALRWVVWNKPGGDAFRSYWGGDTEVSVAVGNSSVIRHKGKENIYTIKNKKEKLVFKAFGANTPQEIQDLLNLNEVNLQQQLDSPFLLSETPGAISAYFNKVAGIDLIDKGRQNIEKEIRIVTSTISVRKQDLEEKTAALHQYDNLEKAEIELEGIEKLEKQRNFLSKRKRKLESVLNTIELIEEEMKKSSSILVLEKKIQQLFNKINKKEQSKTLYIKLLYLQNKIISIDREIRKTHKVVKFENTVITLIEKIQNKRVSQRHLENLTALLTKYSTINKNYQINQQKLVELNKKLALIKVCPFCGTKLKT